MKRRNKHKYSDDECIAMAMLHGAIFYDWKPDISGWESSYTVCSEKEWNETPSREVEFKTKRVAARKYCERHGLLK